MSRNEQESVDYKNTSFREIQLRDRNLSSSPEDGGNAGGNNNLGFSWETFSDRSRVSIAKYCSRGTREHTSDLIKHRHTSPWFFTVGIDAQ